MSVHPSRQDRCFLLALLAAWLLSPPSTWADAPAAPQLPDGPPRPVGAVSRGARSASLPHKGPGILEPGEAVPLPRRDGVDYFAAADDWREPWPANWPKRRAFPPAQTPSRGALDGVIVFANAGHGLAHQNGSWRWARPVLPAGDGGIIEDLGNVDQLSFFAEHCLRAGATVVPMRPVGFQTNEAVVDNADGGAAFEGDWRDGAGRRWFGASDAASRYRFARAVEGPPTARATFRANLPAPGFYPVYVWAADGDDRSNQEYVVRHSGGRTSRRVNHGRVGKGWIYLGTFHFAANAPAIVETHNGVAPDDPGQVVVADAVRFGNGVGDVPGPDGLLSGGTRGDEASRYWIQRMAGNGASPLIHDPNWPDPADDDSDDNVGSPPRMAAYMNRETRGAFHERIFVGFHSNAGVAHARGAVGLYCCEPGHALNPPNGKGTANQLEFAETIGAETNAATSAFVAAAPDAFEAQWGDRVVNVFGSGGVNYTAYGEISLRNSNGEFDATINEVGFHTSPDDAKLLSDPRVRDALARATLRGVVRFLYRRGSAPLAFPPDPPTRLRAVSDAAGQPSLHWTPPAASSLGDEPTGYAVYASSDGAGFAEIARLRGGELDGFPLASRVAVGEARWFRVAATNAGGDSAPSSVVGVLREGKRPRVLLVDAFDRWDRLSLPRQLVDGAEVYRHDPLRSNAGDILVRAGEGVAAWGGGFDSCESECVGEGLVDLARYEAVIWSLGEESTRDQTFSAGEQERLIPWMLQGGRLLATGSEIAWDLDRPGSGPSAGDRAFSRDILRLSFAGDDAETYRVESLPSGPFAGLPAFAFSDGAAGGCDVDHPDRLTPEEGARPALAYVGGREGFAAIAWDGEGVGAGKAICAGFPFETVEDDWIRRELFRRSLLFLLGEADAPRR